MSAANGTQRDIGLDLTRILAFLAVPSVHFFLNSTYYDTAIVGPRMALMTVMRTAFMVCVPLYMLLSGYLSAEKHIPLTRPGLLGYYKKLLPIFLTYALSTGVILLYRALWLGEEQTILSAVKNLLSFQQYSWYMNMYFGLLLLTPFLNALWQSLATPAARRALLAVLLVLTVLPADFVGQWEFDRSVRGDEIFLGYRAGDSVRLLFRIFLVELYLCYREHHGPGVCHLIELGRRAAVSVVGLLHDIAAERFCGVARRHYVALDIGGVAGEDYSRPVRFERERA